MTQEEKRKIANLLIENDWYGQTLKFIAKAYNIDNTTITALINGNKPEITDEVFNKYMEKAEEFIEGKKEKNEEK